MNRMLFVRLTLGGAVCGAFVGILGGALLGALSGAVAGDASLGVEGALIGGVVLALVGAGYGAGQALVDRPTTPKPDVAQHQESVSSHPEVARFPGPRNSAGSAP